MKKTFFVFTVFLFVAISACNDGDKKTGEGPLTPQAQADSLEHEVLEGHNIAMPKSMRIPDLRKEISRIVDSVSKLPAKAKEAAAPYLAKLNSVDKELADAHDSMQSWMDSFGEKFKELNEPSMKDSIEKKIKFFSTEKLKVNDVKDAVLGSVKKAETLIKEKF